MDVIAYRIDGTDDYFTDINLVDFHGMENDKVRYHDPADYPHILILNPRVYAAYECIHEDEPEA